MNENEWQRCRPWIEAALAHGDGTHTIEDIEDGLQRNELAFLPLQKSALICEVKNYPRKRVLHVFLGGGDLAELKTLNDMMDNAAKVLGCSSIQIVGRHGWKRAFREFGYQDKWTVLLKEIPHGQ